ncbi:hypothetical protein M1N24_02175 [Dehalococcoidia bacterium]|nr:hypothetical protein [Dehalococcoidia bacterium]
MKPGSIQNLMAKLTASVESFHERFGLIGPSTREELLGRIAIQEEETLELHHAILEETNERIADEASDVLYVAIGTLLRLNPSLAAKALIDVIEKNHAKTWETHHINPAGKVAPRKTDRGTAISGHDYH